jgi:hypothetical protein
VSAISEEELLEWLRRLFGDLEVPEEIAVIPPGLLDEARKLRTEEAEGGSQPGR